MKNENRFYNKSILTLAMSSVTFLIISLIAEGMVRLFVVQSFRSWSYEYSPHFGVTGQIRSFTHIEKKIKMFHQDNLLYYIDVDPWFDGIKNYDSPEGHAWGEVGHCIVGENLGREIQDFLLKEK
ncbi:hypothetical protein ACQZV8_06795 [Magnetococcales bacterium HHB-1]